MDPIRSKANPLIKRVRAASAGREPRCMVLEGERLVREALLQGFAIERILVSEDRPDRLDQLAAAASGPGSDPRAKPPIHVVDDDVMRHASSLVQPPGVLALVEVPVSPTLESLVLRPDSLCVVACGVQDPGNLGALARTAEAAGAQALLTAESGCSPWNDKALRGSMGSLLRLPILERDRAAAVAAELAERGFRQLRAETRGGTPFEGVDWGGRIALWVTSETGTWPADLSDPEGGHAFEPVSIPMGGGAESLNVTAAAAVLLFAAGRAASAQEEKA